MSCNDCLPPLVVSALQRWRGSPRPPRIPKPGPGQVSVWDFPRPPRIEPVSGSVEVFFGGELIANSDRALRVCETASPPCYYLPPQDVRRTLLIAHPGRSFCEWKGRARYWTVRLGSRTSIQAAWSYPEPLGGYEELRDHIAYYAARVDRCTVRGEVVTPQPGRFYGGWITPELTGPFKGEPGSEGW